tara:strand:+ start:30917 stop:31477 length:561 start_codon:yes stop_codon:yes gene_type:complete
MANMIVKWMTSSSGRDWLGVCASIGCAIHCAAMPFAISYLPALGLSFLADEAFHKVMVFFCLFIAIYAFIPGLIKHRKWAPVLFGTVGLMFITFAAFGIEGDCCADLDDDATVPACCTTDGTKTDTNMPIFQAITTEVDEPTRAQQLLSQFALWISPLGGTFLVLGHLLNKRFGCACNCCPAENAE